MKILVQVELEWRKSSGVKAGAEQRRQVRVKLPGGPAAGGLLWLHSTFVKPNLDFSKIL